MPNLLEKAELRDARFQTGVAPVTECETLVPTHPT